MFCKNLRGDSRARRLRIEQLEDRRMLAAVTVSNNSDVVNGNVLDDIAALIANPGADGISLREAILAANLEQGADTIDFAQSLNSSTILLTEGELSITDSVIIDATSLTSGIMIDASGNDDDVNVNNGDGSRVFSISDPNFNGGDVTLAGLTITGGDVSGNGGGIFYEGAGFGGGNLTIRDSVIRDNYAQGDGGGIHATVNDAVTMTIEDSVVSGNQASASTPVKWVLRATKIADFSLAV